MAVNATLARLSTIMSLDSSQLTRGVGRASAAVRRHNQALRAYRRELRQVNRGLQRVVSGFFSFRTAIAGIAGLAGLGLFFRNAVESATALQELSTATGVSVRQLDRLGRAFEADGVAQQSFSRGVRNIVRRIGEARDGMQSYIDVFERLGIAQQDLASQSTSQLVERTFEGLFQLSDASEQAAAAADLLERAGLDLLPTLARGRAEFAAAQRQVELFGVRSDESAAALKDLDQSFVNLQQASTFLRTELAASFSRDLQNLINGIAFEVAELGRNLDGTNRGLRTTVQIIGTFLTVIVGGVLLRPLIALVSWFGRLFRAIRLLRRSRRDIRNLGDATERAAQQARAWRTAIGGIGRIAGAIVGALGLRELYEGLGEAFDNVAESGQRVNQEIRQAALTFKQASAAGASLGGWLHSVGLRAEDARAEIAQLREELRGDDLRELGSRLISQSEQRFAESRLDPAQVASRRAERQILEEYARRVSTYEGNIQRLQAEAERLQRQGSEAANERIAQISLEVAANERNLEVLQRQRAEVQRYAAAVGEAVAATESRRIAEAEANRQAEEAAQRIIQQQREAQMEAQRMLDEEAAAARQYRDSIANTLSNITGDAFFDFIRGADSAGDALKRLASRVVDLVVELLIVQPLLNSLAGAFSGIGGFLGGGIGGIFGFGGGGASGAADGAEGADGVGGMQGDITAGDGGQAEQALLRAVRGAGGVGAGGGDEIVIIAPSIAVTDAGVEAIIAGAVPSIIEATKRSILSELRSPGSFRQRFAGV